VERQGTQSTYVSSGVRFRRKKGAGRKGYPLSFQKIPLSDSLKSGMCILALMRTQTTDIYFFQPVKVGCHLHNSRTNGTANFCKKASVRFSLYGHFHAVLMGYSTFPLEIKFLFERICLHPKDLKSAIYAVHKSLS